MSCCVGRSIGQQLVRRVGKQEIDVELGGKPSQLSAGCRRGERRRTGNDAAFPERRPVVLEPGRHGPKLGRLRHEPRQDHDAMRVSHERLGDREQRVDVRVVRDGHEDRSLGDPLDVDGCARTEVQRRVLLKDRSLQLVERRARLDPEPVHERAARVLVDVQGLRLPTRPVQRGHQLHAEALAERVRGRQCLELSDELGVAPEREVSRDPELHRGQLDLLEPSDGRLGEVLVGEIRERRASPQRKRLVEPLRRIGRQPANEQAPPLVHEALEPVEVELVGLDSNDVARRSRGQHIRRKCLAQPRDVDPQRSGSVLGRVLAPEVVDQPVTGNDLVEVKKEHSEKGTRLRPAEGDLAAVIPRLERSQDPELHLWPPGRGR